ncbi:MAG: bifunctional folylpolyglutamate synthase/dihydrofolate synthase [Chitinophagaceae bacterium]|nr:bifunctional folylpolyglutamate synthase/dihydrofolate synthase [Chitinophagaceae bacterium]
MFTRVGAAAYKADLQNTILLCEALGNPEKSLKCIHIAGTNGKGSCSHMLSAVLQTAGYKTALYTSPHIIDFRERIRINGEMVSREWVIAFIDRIKPLIETMQPSFFEVTVAMAFSYFAEQKIDIAVIEVGLGGLLDSTNIITPLLSVITNISLDHTALLGKDLESIATQKAGIIKTHVPVVIGERQTETENIFFTHAIMNEAPIFFAEENFQVAMYAYMERKSEMKVMHLPTGKIWTIQTDLQGLYQKKNICTVLCALEVLRQLGWKIDDAHIHEGLKSVMSLTGIRGRLERVHESPTIIFDVSHNEAGITELVNQLETIPYQQLWIITGFVNDKDVRTVLRILPHSAEYFFTQAQIPRALPYLELYDQAMEAGLKGRSIATVTEALQAALNMAEKEDLILVTGSFFLLEEAYRFVQTI